MRCPRCNQENQSPRAPCAACGFTGPLAQVEELTHLRYLLRQIESWGPGVVYPNVLLQRYERKVQAIETALGLAQPSPSPLAAEEARWEIWCLEGLQELTAFWRERGWVWGPAGDRLREDARERAASLQERLEGAPPGAAFVNREAHRERLEYLARTLDQAHSRGLFRGAGAYAAALSDLRSRAAQLEGEAAPLPAAAPAVIERARPAVSAAPVPVPGPPAPPRPRVTWEQVWQTLLARRTLNVLLFLGAFLLIASATYGVVNNWQRLPSWAQLLCIVFPTVVCYATGWALRSRFHLRASGIAVTAVGSLLVPLDVLAVAVIGQAVPETHWHWVWLITSAVCLVLYTFTALRIRAEFFGYLVYAAAGSLHCATLHVAGVPVEWWLAALVALALALEAAAVRLTGRLETLSAPLRFSALAWSGALLPAGFGWWLARGLGPYHLGASLAVGWALGAALFALAAARERSPLLGQAAAAALPVAVCLTLPLGFEPWQVHPAWYALGLAALSPGYIWLGHRLLSGRHSEHRFHGRTARGWGLALMIGAAGWAILDTGAAAATHAVLGGAVALAAALWKRPRALPLVSFLALSSVMFTVATAHLGPTGLCLGWAALALLHIPVALRLRPAPDYAARLFAAAVGIGALALLSPLALAQRNLWTYALGQWLALAGWLAWLDRRSRNPGLTALLGWLGPLRPTVLHWAMALPLPFFAAAVVDRLHAPEGWLSAVTSGVAWICLRVGTGRWLQGRAEQAPRLGRATLGVRQASFPWLVVAYGCSAVAVALALAGNLWWQSGGRLREVGAIVALLAITALYSVSAHLFRRRLLVWLAAVVLIAPWTLLTAWGWFVWNPPEFLPQYALAWAILAGLYLVTGLILTAQSRGTAQDFGFPLRTVGHLLLPFALFWGITDSSVSSFTWGLGTFCYVASAVADHRRGLHGWHLARFLYPAVAAFLAWAVFGLNAVSPTAPYEAYGLMLLAFVLPLLSIGRLLRRRDPADALPFYLGAYGVAVVGTLLVANRPPYLTAALAYDVALCILSAWIFREPAWGYPAAALGPVALLTGLTMTPIPPERRGWCLIGLAFAYLAAAWLLRRGGFRVRSATLRPYSTPPLAAAFAVAALGLLPSSSDLTGAFWAYLAVALFYALAAAWLREPLLLWAAAALAAVPYGVGVAWLRIEQHLVGLAVFPGVAIALALAHLLDWTLPPPDVPGSEGSALRRLARKLDWWAAPWYVLAYVGALSAVWLSWSHQIPLIGTLALAVVVFAHATWRFRSRLALLAAGVLAQATALATIDAWGWLEHPAWAALAFLPVTFFTAGLALAVQLRRKEGSPLGENWALGWSRPLYLLLALNLLGGQLAALSRSEPGAVVTALHVGLVAGLATIWVQRALPLLAAGLGAVALCQGLAWSGAAPTAYPVAVALLSLVYGLAGYGVMALRPVSPRLGIWRQPLQWSGLGLSAVALVWASVAGLDGLGQVLRVLVGWREPGPAAQAQVQMVLWVLAILGLLYLTAAVARRWWALGYVAIAMILAAWAMWWRFTVTMVGFQWYAVPAMLYLLGVGWLEWHRGHRRLARWVDRAGLLVGPGSAWVQSIPGVADSGWPYALLLGAEALGLVWWGSIRRRKEFLYGGMAAVLINAITQIIAGALSPYRWLVLGIVGLLLVGLAVLVERRLERIREMSAELHERLEGWD